MEKTILKPTTDSGKHFVFVCKWQPRLFATATHKKNMAAWQKLKTKKENNKKATLCF